MKKGTASRICITPPCYPGRFCDYLERLQIKVVIRIYIIDGGRSIGSCPRQLCPHEPQISHILNNRNLINGEVPPQRLRDERTESPSSISDKPGKLN